MLFNCFFRSLGGLNAAKHDFFGQGLAVAELEFPCAPDLWANIQSMRSKLTSSRAVTNTPYTLANTLREDVASVIPA